MLTELFTDQRRLTDLVEQYAERSRDWRDRAGDDIRRLNKRIKAAEHRLATGFASRLDDGMSVAAATKQLMSESHLLDDLTHRRELQIDLRQSQIHLQPVLSNPVWTTAADLARQMSSGHSPDIRTALDLLDVQVPVADHCLLKVQGFIPDERSMALDRILTFGAPGSCSKTQTTALNRLARFMRDYALLCVGDRLGRSPQQIGGDR